MPRKYAVLKQFTIDLNRLLTEAEVAYSDLCATKNPDPSVVLRLFRPIHSLKGICGMVEESKILVQAFHRLEDALPPLLPVRSPKPPSEDWRAIADLTFRAARETEQLLLRKIELWRELGADQNEARGLIIAFRHDLGPVTVWVPITSLLGLAGAEDVSENGGASLGARSPTGEVLVIEVPEGSVSVYFDEIRSTCTRLEAVQAGVPQSFKEWWHGLRKTTLKVAA